MGFRDFDYETIMINNPETVSNDFDTADRHILNPHRRSAKCIDREAVWCNPIWWTDSIKIGKTISNAAIEY